MGGLNTTLITLPSPVFRDREGNAENNGVPNNVFLKRTDLRGVGLTYRERKGREGRERSRGVEEG